MASFNVQLTTTIKLIAVIFSVIISLGGALYAVEDRYVTQKQAATSLQSFDQAVKKDLVSLELQILNNSLESATDQYHKQRQLVREYPGDIELQHELDRIRSRMITIQEKIDDHLAINF